MQLDDKDLQYLCECAITAAKQAGQIIQAHANKTVSVQHKQGGISYASQVVTEVDLLSEAAIIKILKPTCERYNLALLTEESIDNKERLEKDYFWCIDPMDGTLSFIESTPGYSVSIALVSKSGLAHIGVVFDPVTQTIYSAIRGKGVLLNGKAWDLSYKSSLTQTRPLTLVCDRGFVEKSYYAELHQALESIALKHGMPGLQTIEKNGAVLNACWVMENSPSVYFKCPKAETGGGSLWDFSATAVLFNELDFVASDFYGQALDLNRADSTFMNHRGVLFSTHHSLATDIQGLLALCS